MVLRAAKHTRLSTERERRAGIFVGETDIATIPNKSAWSRSLCMCGGRIHTIGRCLNSVGLLCLANSLSSGTTAEIELDKS